MNWFKTLTISCAIAFILGIINIFALQYVGVDIIYLLVGFFIILAVDSYINDNFWGGN